MSRGLAALVLALMFHGAASAADIHQCDVLAANPPDPDRVSVGIPRAEVDLPAAIAACTEAVAAFPDEPRYAYQLGRVYFYAGDTPNALLYIGRAADMNYRQALFIMGAMINNRREGVPYDICEVEKYWLNSARLDHVHARVSYVRHVTKGYFEDCPIEADLDELRQMIDVEASGAEEYFLRLLVEDLKEDVEAYAAIER